MTATDSGHLHVLAILSAALIAEGGIYFPLTEVTIPVPPTHAEVKVLDVRANLDSGVTASGDHVTYDLQGPQWLQRRGGHQLWVVDVPKADGTKEAVLRASHSSGSVADMTIHLWLLTAQDMLHMCHSGGQGLCFWERADYQVYENTAMVPLGPLGPSYLAGWCPGTSTVAYHLVNATALLSLSSGDGNRTGYMYTTSTWDRDGEPAEDKSISGPRVLANVTCTLSSGTVTRRHHHVVGVNVLDVNDNPPTPQEGTSIRVYLGNHGVIYEGETIKGNELIFQDKDTLAVNEHEVSILDDEMGVWELACTHSGHTDHLGWDMSFKYCGLVARKSLTLPDDPGHWYRVVVQMRDTAMEPVVGASSHVNVTLLLNTGTRPAPPPAAGVPAVSPTFPNWTSILRYARNLSRVVQPEQGPHLTGVRTRLQVTDPGAFPFNVTPTAGIVYVANTKKLRNWSGPIDVHIQWMIPNVTQAWSTVKVTVDVVDDKAPVCDVTTGRRWCSSRKDRSSCLDTCGEGTGRASTTRHGIKGGDMETTPTGGCAWRSLSHPPTTYTVNYSTCTPDIDTCPDTYCDPLEEMVVSLCLQDCVLKSKAYGFIQVNSHGRGILRAYPVCTCDRRDTCVCQEVDVRVDSPHPGTGNTTALPTASTDAARDVTPAKDSRSSCGGTCKFAVVVGSLLFICSVGGFIFWRYRVSGKGRRQHKFMGSVGSMSGMHSDYVERSLQPADGHPHDAGTPMASPDPRTTPDPKWEFPRSRLVIEQTLGEGEFGRVLRARAIDIGGVPGSTTVAVKTLKEDASTTELADLLSEYQLLKEVSHPHVVRLLGACTLPGAPVYLIIEFAEHGSLRNYLRKSRHLESDGRIPCSFEASPSMRVADLPPAPSPATPRDILSFAWQISKGMAYLSDIKLVHRDLAARNVLVGTGKLCKISDFGLTRDVYEDDAYLKRSKGRVPVKWMALESLADHMYTSKSDVWSFGVLLWELVTLGASPYPGVAVHNLFHLLGAGYRMERPDNCSCALYRVMRSCWREDPSERPPFKELTAVFEKMLEDGVEYLDLNPRIVHNRTYFTSLSSSRDDLDEDELAYGNLNLLATDSVNYLSRHPRHPRHPQLQASVSRTPLLSAGDADADGPHKRPDGTSTAASGAVADSEAADKAGESPRLTNAYLSPIRQGDALNRDGPATGSLTAVSLPQPYINMSTQPKRGASPHDLLASTVTPF